MRQTEGSRQDDEGNVVFHESQTGLDERNIGFEGSRRFDVPSRIWQDCRDDDGTCEFLLSQRAGADRFER